MARALDGLLARLPAGIAFQVILVTQPADPAKLAGWVGACRGGPGARSDLGRHARAALDVVPHMPLGSTSLRPSSWTISSSRATATVWTGSARCSETRLAPFRSWCSRAGPMTTWRRLPWCRLTDPSTPIPKTVSSARLLSSELCADDERLGGRKRPGAIVRGSRASHVATSSHIADVATELRIGPGGQGAQ